MRLCEYCEQQQNDQCFMIMLCNIVCSTQVHIHLSHRRTARILELNCFTETMRPVVVSVIYNLWWLFFASTSYIRQLMCNTIKPLNKVNDIIIYVLWWTVVGFLHFQEQLSATIRTGVSLWHWTVAYMSSRVSPIMKSNYCSPQAWNILLCLRVCEHIQCYFYQIRM